MILRPLLEVWRRPAVREVLLWCLPALLVGLVLRVVLTAQMPYAFFHDDAPDFLTTPDKLIFQHELELHAKKTFLVPAFFTVPFLLRIPAMIFIPVVQHGLGLGLIVLVGALTRLWFRWWRVFIVPLTLVAAANPFLLWYEHTLMAETVYVFCTVLVVLAGTLYALAPSWKRFIFLAVALILEAGARPEGKLLFGFGLFLLVLVHWRAGELPFARERWRASAWPRVLILFVTALTLHFLTKTAQAGLLLYTAVARLTPTELKVAPGFEKYIAPVRAELQEKWSRGPFFPAVRDRRKVAAAVETYLRDQEKGGGNHRSTNDFCLKLATETCRRNFFSLPAYAGHKFRVVSNDAPAGNFKAEWLFDKQRSALAGNAGDNAENDGEPDSEEAALKKDEKKRRPSGSLERNLRLAKGLTGQNLTTRRDLEKFIEGNYQPLDWFNNLSDRWLKTVNAWRLPDSPYLVDGFVRYYWGVPWYFLLAGAGVLVAMLRPGRLQLLHVAWGLTVLAFFYTIMLTANVKPRFRFVFEPFWYVYLALLLETAVLLVVWVASRGGRRNPETVPA